MRRFLSIALTLLLVISLSGCFLLEPSKPKKLTTYYSGSAVVSVRYYHLTDEGDYRFEELAEDKIDDFVEEIDSIEFSTKSFHTDYFWGGTCGVEMELEDGTYLTCDGTKLMLSGASVDSGKSNEEKIRSTYIDVKNGSYWDYVIDYFPSIEENGDKLYT